MPLSCWSHPCLMRVGDCALDAPRRVHGWSRVSRRRTAIVAIQTAVVAVLAVVVFLTLLQPEGGDMPSGLEAPAQGATGGAQSDYLHNRSRQGDDATRDGDGRGAPNARPPASADALGGPPFAGGAVPGVGDPDGDSPTADQYATTLARLSDDLY